MEPQSSSPRKKLRVAAVWAGAAALVAAVAAPFLMATGAGRLIGSLWVSVLGAVAAILGGLFAG
ncbi:MAG: hypothetical protein R3C25_06085 [Hyphomonadaceae bacterium]